jgi:amino acid transporter
MPERESDANHGRTIGLLGATGIGVGAIVGGGIFVLAGVAFASAGPAAMVAFALNGAVAFLTAMSFAEISSAFPESGGAYTFAKKVLSVRAAFGVGWILWFAYIVAGVLYALGFASFAALALQGIWDAAGRQPPDWFAGQRLARWLAVLATLVYGYSLIRKSTGGGQWATLGKLILFAGLVVAGVVGLARQPLEDTTSNISPFFEDGALGLIMAMGFTFIALQGFDLIAAVAGEVKDPGRTIPRAMFLSLGCALIIYLPLLFLVGAVGVEPGSSISEVATAQPENVIPIAAHRFLGATGYWLVIVAAILSTLSALHANVLAASRVANAMATDRTLPEVLGEVHDERGTPVAAIYATALTLIAIVFMVPGLAAAGAAASLIFLIAFLLAHITTFLARRRGGTVNAPYRTPWFPVVPVVGGAACAGLALFQAFAVPEAGGIVLIWLGLGVILYWSLFARRAQMADAASEAFDPMLVQLRGQSPLVLVPIANPAQAAAMIAVANELAPGRGGKVLLLSVVLVAPDHPHGEVPDGLDAAQKVVDEALRLSYAGGYMPEALITAAPSPLAEIRRIAEEHHCGSLLLGLSRSPGKGEDDALESLINDVDADVALMSAPPGWRLNDARRVIVPIGGRGTQHELRARLLASICRSVKREIVFVTVVRMTTTDAEIVETRNAIQQVADLKVKGTSDVQIVRAEDPAAAIIAEAADYDLMVLGLGTGGWRKKSLDGFALRLARGCECATLLLSRRKPRAYELLDPLRDGVVASIRGAVKGGRGKLHVVKDD